jgi:hypothetical protein
MSALFADKRMVVRSYNEELEYLERLTPHCWRIKKGFQPNMNVEVPAFLLGTRPPSKPWTKTSSQLKLSLAGDGFIFEFVDLKYVQWF